MAKVLQLCPLSSSPQQDLIYTQHSRCRLPNSLFLNGTLQPNELVLLIITEKIDGVIPDAFSRCIEQRKINYSLLNNFPVCFLCHSFPWPSGEFDQRITFSPTMIIESLPENVTQSTMKSIAQGIDVDAGIMLTVHKISNNGDAISIEAKVSNISTNLSSSDLRLLKRNFRNNYIMNGALITNKYQNLPTNVLPLDSIDVEVIRTSPSSGVNSLTSSSSSYSSSPSNRSPNTQNSFSNINAVRVSSTTMITLTIMESSSSLKTDDDDDDSKQVESFDKTTHDDCIDSKINEALKLISTPSSQPRLVFHSLVELMLLPLWFQSNNRQLFQTTLETSTSPSLDLLPRGLLMSGPPGVGKTYAVGEAVRYVQELGVEVLLINVRGAEILSLGPGDAEAELRNIFEKANLFTSSSSSSTHEAFASEMNTKEHDIKPNVKRCAVIFLDELDALCPKRDGKLGSASGSLAIRCVAQLLTLLDGMSSSYSKSGKKQEEDTSKVNSDSGNVSGGGDGGSISGGGRVVVIGATNRPNDLDEAIRRPGRLDKEIHLQTPNEEERLKFLLKLFQIQQHKTESRSSVKERGSDVSQEEEEEEEDKDIDEKVQDDARMLIVKRQLREVAEKCVGFVAADMAALYRQAKLEQLKQYLDSTDLLNISHTNTSSSSLTNNDESLSSSSSSNYIKTMTSHESLIKHLLTCLNQIHASGLKNRWVTQPKTKWSEIGGYDHVKLKLRKAVEWPRLYKSNYLKLNLSPPRGVLLYGPPGCSKTLLVKALASSSSMSFIVLSSADVYSPMVGDAEAAIRRAFALARHATPAILFFDEIDALVVNRAEGGGGVESRVLSTFLNEMDGVSSLGNDGLLVMAATNRPQSLDAALIRPGRFEAVIHVPPPDLEARKHIFSVHLKNIPISDEIDFHRLSQLTNYFTGAEIGSVVREAALRAMRNICDTFDNNDNSTKESLINNFEEEEVDNLIINKGVENHVQVEKHEINMSNIKLNMNDLEASISKIKPLLSDKVKANSFSEILNTGSWG